MLPDNELEYLREVWRRAVLSPSAQACKLPAFTDMVFDPGGTDNIEVFLRDADAPASLRLVVESAVLEIGLAYAGEVLNYAPLPLDDVSKPRRWQLQRQLARAVERMGDDELQQLVWRAQSQPERLDDGYESSALAVLQSITPRDRHLIDSKGRRLYPRPNDGESPSAWCERYLRFASRDASISFGDEADLDARFVVRDDLPPEYRDVL